MKYLSPQLEMLHKKKSHVSLIKHEISCGIFQEYSPTLPKGPILKETFDQ